ncbi:MAG: alpha/beta hydrolase [Bacteroidetes bacterium]|nr:alpha/beta hydrolase [Bacteroidota bacterium]
MEDIYCISGLGADERIFDKLSIPNAKLHFIKWLTPENNEPIEVYAKRISKQVVSQNPLLMGVSFGGMMAVEISKHIPVKKTILISSVKSRKELPQWMKITGNLRLNKLAPSKQQGWMGPIENYFLGADGEEEKRMAKDFRKNIDPIYLHWAIDKVVNWQNNEIPSALFHLHGTSDKTFPIKNIRATHIVEGGNHFMVMNRASEVSGVLEKIVSE